jgi:hypothetical protein
LSTTFAKAHDEKLVPVGTERHARRFVIAFSVTFACLTLAIGTLNFVTNPNGLYPTNLVKGAKWNDRPQKSKLMRQTSAEVLILGTSHSMKISPKEVEALTGMTAFNAAVSNGTAEDELIFLRDAVEGNHWPVKLVLVQVDPDILGSGPLDPTLRRDPDLSRYLGSGSPIEEKWENVTALLNFDQTLHSLYTYRWILKGSILSQHFEPDGYLRYDQTERERAQGTFNLQVRVAASGTFARFANVSPPSAARESVFNNLLEYCKAHSIAVKIFLPPLHPSVYSALQKTNFARVNAETIEYARTAAAKYGAEFYNFNDLASFDGKADGFYDAEHMDEANASLLEGVLLKPEPAIALK